MSKKFTSKKIWLIGASEGIGAELAKQLSASGAQLAISARNSDKLDAVIAELPGAGHISVPMDVTDSASVHRGWELIASHWGKIDMVIYNAGTYEPISAKQFDLSEAEAMLDVNFRGVLRMLDCVIPSFLTQRKGHIVLVGSVAAYRGLPREVGYGASKAALFHLAENLYIDLSDSGIKTQIVSPGFVKTRLTQKNDFKMPFIISSEQAAERIVKGINSDAFEIHFPRRFSYGLKALGFLPHKIYLRIASSL